MTQTPTPLPRTLPPLLPVALLLACGDVGNGPSNGSLGTLGGPDVVVNAVTEEVFAVGSVAGDTWDSFGSVSSLHFDTEANLHIFDDLLNQILVVGPDGSPVRTVGGPGEGPGEFNDPSAVVVGRDGSYAVMGFLQIDLFEPGGVFAERVNIDMIIWDGTALPNGRLITDRIAPLGGFTESAEDFADSEVRGRPVHMVSLDGAEPELVYTAWELPEEQVESELSGDFETGMQMSFGAGRAFEPNLDIDVLTDGRLALIDSIGYRVKLIGLDGSVTGTVERPIEPLPVDDAIREAARERYRERQARAQNLPVGLPIQIEMADAEELSFADEVPVLFGLKVDWEDRIWVERRGPTGEGDGPIDIVTPDGGYVGTLPPEGLRTPDAFGPGGLMAYVELDDMDVPTVRVLRLVALEPAG